MIAMTISCLVATATVPISAAERQRTGVAHEDGGRRRIEPEEAEARADDGAEDDGKLTGAGHEIDLQVVRKDRVAGEIGDDAEGGGGDHHRHDRKAVETVRQVDGIARRDDDEAAEDDEHDAEIEHEVLEEGKGDRGAEGRAGRPGGKRRAHHEIDGDAGNDEFDAEARLAGKALVGSASSP